MNMGVMSVISTFWRPIQEYQELEASLGCRTELYIESQNLRMRMGVGGRGRGIQPLSQFLLIWELITFCGYQLFYSRVPLVPIHLKPLIEVR